MYLPRENRWRFVFFFFQAEDGIRDYKVTGVQTCALPISRGRLRPRPLRICAVQGIRTLADELANHGSSRPRPRAGLDKAHQCVEPGLKIGRASCRERV